MNSFFTLHSFLEVGKTQDLPSKFWQTLGDALSHDSSLVHQYFDCSMDLWFLLDAGSGALG
jgi:hypothetical protein